MSGPTLDEFIEVADFRAAIQRFLRQSERIADRHGLTSQRYLLLLMIKGAPDRSECATVTELSQRLDLAQHTVTELVARSARAGLIRRRVSPEDRRVAFLSLTAKGRRRLVGAFMGLAAERQSLRTLLIQSHT